MNEKKQTNTQLINVQIQELKEGGGGWVSERTWLLISFSECAVFSLSPKLLMRMMHPCFQTSANVNLVTLYRRSAVNFSVYMSIFSGFGFLSA